MADFQGDSEDSRTLLAGRKRGFEEASQDQDAHDLEEGNASHKRIREDSSYEPADVSVVEASPERSLPSGPLSNSEVEKVAPLAAVSSISTAAILPQDEKATPRSTATEQLESFDTGVGAAAGLRAGLMETETASMPQEEAQIATIPPPKTSWNNGIQKGLRTSFASKKIRPNPMSAPPEPEGTTEPEAVVDQHVQPGLAGSTEPSRAQSSSRSDNDDSLNMPASLGVEEQGANPVAEPKQKRRRKKSKGSNDDIVPVQHLPPFKKLKQKQLLELSCEERSAYKQAKRLHDANDPEKKRRKDEREELDRQRQAAKQEASTTTGSGKTKRTAETLRAEAEANTVAAAKVLADFGWPLPKSQKATAQMIHKGLTYYPRKYDRSSTYNKGNVDFVMTPNLNPQGFPIQFPDLSFNEFAVKFLILYSKQWPLLAANSLARAFGMYVNFFYANHYGDDASWRQKIKDLTSPNNNAFTLEQAEAEATRRMSLTSASSTDPNSSKSELELEKELEDSEDNDIIMIEDSEESEDDEVSRPSTSSDGEIINLDLNDAQLLLQRRYFPSANGTTIQTGHCLACSRIGHDSANCPALSCASCGDRHSEFRCPDRQRCAKCRERGHSKEECPEKLGVPKSELKCEFCNSKEHLEIECHLIWRSFAPKPEEIRTVRDIPVDCYSCGMSNHFGPDCGLHAGRLLTGGVTWSRSNLEKYVDPTSDRRALSAGIDYSLPPRKGFSIKGKANDPITFEDSSDDGEAFIRPKIQAAERGHIRFNERQETRPPVHGLPRRPASPVAPYRNGYEGGFSNEEDSRYGMSSNRYYPDAPHNARPLKGGDRGGNSQKPPRRGENSASRGRVTKNAGPKGYRSRRGR